MKHTWFLYILQCRDGSYYTGITKDLSRRLQTHNEGKGARYTRARLPVKLIYYESCPNQSRALIRESEIKSLPRKEKIRLAGQKN